MPGAHALLSPSAAKRWMTCTPSARVESQLPEQTSTYAREGTLAHAVAECLLHFYHRTQQIAVFDKPWDHFSEFAHSQPDLEKLAAEALQEGLDFREIVETVHDTYVAIVWSDFVKARAEDIDAELLIEVRVDLSDYVPESFGSSDAIIISEDCIHVYDLKYGPGVRVSAKGNLQMRLYALGAILGPGETYILDTVRMTIVQPRLHAVSTDEVHAADLLRWAASDLKPVAHIAFDGKGDFVPGDHCEFCRAKGTCTALLEYTRRLL